MLICSNSTDIQYKYTLTKYYDQFRNTYHVVKKKTKNSKKSSVLLCV